MKRLFSLSFYPFWMLVAHAVPVVLIEEGQPRAAIVFADGEPQAEEVAAEISRTLEKMSEAKLPVAVGSADGEEVS